LIHFLYPEIDFSFSKYNYLEHTFTHSDPLDCWSMEWLLDTVGLDYKNTISTTQKSYVKLNIHFPTEYTDLQYMPNEIWETIANSDNTYLLLYQATEATPFYFWKHRWNRLKSFLIKKNIPPHKVYYISGDLNAVSNHKRHMDNYWCDINVLGINIFEMMHLFRHNANSGENYKDIIDLHTKSEKNKNFLNLNKRMRPNKQALIYYIRKNNLLENNIVSNLWYESEVLSQEEFDTQYNFNEANYDELVEWVQQRIVIDNDNDQHSDKKLYVDTKYSLVSETYTGSTVNFITEKTYKPILMGHPFLIHGTNGTLDYLKQIGYETFPELFDESYDTYTSSKDQLKIIVENLKKDVIINKNVLEKCKHNQNLFLQQPTKEIVKKQLEEFLL